MNEKGLDQPLKKNSVEDYIGFERTSATKNEYLNGRMLAAFGF